MSVRRHPRRHRRNRKFHPTSSSVIDTIHSCESQSFLTSLSLELSLHHLLKTGYPNTLPHTHTPPYSHTNLVIHHHKNTMSDINANERFDAAVTAMTLPENRFDVTIICTTDDHQAAFWMSKLDTTKAEDDNSTSPFPMVLAVSEDWGGSGAGNGLGTLYAWTKACSYAKTHKDGIDLEALLTAGTISASLYHTAGKGTRMAPLPASENNNKPGVVRIRRSRSVTGNPWSLSSLTFGGTFCTFCVGGGHGLLNSFFLVPCSFLLLHRNFPFFVRRLDKP